MVAIMVLAAGQGVAGMPESSAPLEVVVALRVTRRLQLPYARRQHGCERDSPRQWSEAMATGGERAGASQNCVPRPCAMGGRASVCIACAHRSCSSRMHRPWTEQYYRCSAKPPRRPTFGELWRVRVWAHPPTCLATSASGWIAQPAG